MSMRKWLLSLAGLLVVGFFGYAGLSLHVLLTCSPETNSSCAIGDSGTHIPRFACRWYLGSQLTGEKENGNAQSVLHMAIGAYLTNPSSAQKIMELALSEGAKVNGHSPVSGYPPLHEAILLNEPGLADFLLKRGADPEIEDRNKGLTAHKLLAAIEERNPDQDLSGINALINQN